MTDEREQYLNYYCANKKCDARKYSECDNCMYEKGRVDVIDAVVDEVIFPLLDEYDIHLWEHIDYIELAEKWVEAVKNNPYPKIKDYDKQRKKYLKDWIIEKVKR